MCTYLGKPEKQDDRPCVRQLGDRGPAVLPQGDRIEVGSQKIVATDADQGDRWAKEQGGRQLDSGEIGRALPGRREVDQSLGLHGVRESTHPRRTDPVGS
jgi:hypothetical protein